MSDIVERLRVDNLLGLPGAGILGACREAADIIESLRQQLKEALAVRENCTLVPTHELKKMQEQLHAQQICHEHVIAEKDAEIERLKYAQENPKFNGRYDTWQAVAGKYRAEAAASQAREQQLREALECYSKNKKVGLVASIALALPTDTTALEALIQKAGEVMRERCVFECGEQQMTYAAAGYERHAQAIAGLSGTIRALSSLTLEDIK